MKTQNIISLLSTIVILHCCTIQLHAEVPDGPKDKILEPGFRLLLIGPYGGINNNIHRGAFQTTDGTFICCNFDEGSGIGPVFGAKAFIPLTDEINFSPRLAYEDRSGEFTRTINDIPIRGAGNRIEFWNTEQKLDAKLRTLSVDVFGSYTVTPFGLYIAAGPSIAFTLSKSFKTTETIVAPANVRYPDGTTSKEFPGQTLVEVNSLFIALRGGVGVLFPITQSIHLNPEVLYSFPLNKVSKDYDWKASAVQMTLGILFSI